MPHSYNLRPLPHREQDKLERFFDKDPNENNKLNITIKLLSGNNYSIDIDSKMDYKEFFKYVSEITNIDVGSFRLLYKNQRLPQFEELENQTYNIYDFNIKNNSSIHSLLRLGNKYQIKPFRYNRADWFPFEPYNNSLQNNFDKHNTIFIDQPKPKLVELYWEEDNLPHGNDVAHINDYDIVVNKNESGYRNEGVYIFKDGKICNLSYQPDDYGCLPDWVRLRKHDFGYSYFSEYMIDHNNYVPFKPSEWIMGKTYINKTNLTFQFYFDNVSIITEFYRKDDGALIKLDISVMFSLIDIGGPTDHVTYVGGRSRDMDMQSRYKSSKEEFTLNYKLSFNNDGSYKRVLSNNKNFPKVTISEFEIINACTMVRKLLSNLKGTVYLNCIGPCKVSLDSLQVDKNGIWKKVVFPITRK